MPIALKNGFYRNTDHFCRYTDQTDVPALGIESDRLDECIALVVRERVNSVFGAPHFGFFGHDLDFLNDIPWVQHVWFWDIDLRDVEGLYALRSLKSFGVGPRRPHVDFSRFPKLKSVVIEPRPRDRGLGSLTELEMLHLWRFRPKDGTFGSMAFPESLTELQINWANLTSFESLPPLPNLVQLDIAYCRNLSTLGDFGAKFPNLKHMTVLACGKVSVAEGQRVVGTLPKLNHACIGNSKKVNKLV